MLKKNYEPSFPGNLSSKLSKTSNCYLLGEFYIYTIFRTYRRKIVVCCDNTFYDDQTDARREKKILLSTNMQRKYECYIRLCASVLRTQTYTHMARDTAKAHAVIQPQSLSSFDQLEIKRIENNWRKWMRYPMVVKSLQIVTLREQ